MPTTFNGTRVEAIPGAPLPYGLVSAANLVLVDDVHELNGVEWVPMSCAEASATDWCVPSPQTKTFTGTDSQIAQPVVVYYGHTCPPIGQDNTEAETYARAGLAIGEPRALEAWVQTAILAPGATNLTPGGPVPTASALSLLEGALGVDYGGIGVLHAPVGAGALLSTAYLLLKEGARLVTWVGNRVALGAGYEVANVDPNGDPADPGTYWLYISGPVTIRQEQPDVPGGPPTGDGALPNTYRGVIDTELNDRYVLAERASVVQIECGIFAAQIERPETVS